MKIFGKRKEDISKSPLDFYSFGHLIFGHIAYIIIFLIGLFSEIPLIRDAMIRRVLGFTIFVGLIWEIVENNTFVKYKLKKHVDSLNNSLCDILCVFIGASIIGIVMFFIGYTNVLFLLINTLILITYFMFFYIYGIVAFGEC